VSIHYNGYLNSVCDVAMVVPATWCRQIANMSTCRASRVVHHGLGMGMTLRKCTPNKTAIAQQQDGTADDKRRFWQHSPLIPERSSPNTKYLYRPLACGAGGPGSILHSSPILLTGVHHVKMARRHPHATNVSQHRTNSSRHCSSFAQIADHNSTCSCSHPMCNMSNAHRVGGNV
jgi:hypothetical protein